MPEDSQEAPGLYETDIDEIEGDAEKKWEDMSDEEKLKKLEDI